MALGRTEFATGEEVARLGDHFEERLEAAGFFYPEGKVAGMKLSLRNMWSRLGLDPGRGADIPRDVAADCLSVEAAGRVSCTRAMV